MATDKFVVKNGLLVGHDVDDGINMVQVNGTIKATNLSYSGEIAGDGSGLTDVDAVTLDGIDSTSFLRSDANDSASGDITFSGRLDMTSTNSDLPSHYFHNLYSGNIVYSHAWPSGYTQSNGATQFRWRAGDGVSGYNTLTWHGTNGLNADGPGVFTGSVTAPGIISTGSIGNLGTGIGQQLELGTTGLSTLRFDSDAWRLYAGGVGGSAEVFRITQTGSATFTSDLTVTGNLTVDGTTTTLNTAILDVEDINITIASGAADAAAADGAGITVDGANATLTYSSAEDGFNFNKSVDITGGLDATGGITATGRGYFGNSLTRPDNLADLTDSALKVGGADVHLHVASLSATGNYAVAVQSGRESDNASFTLALNPNGGKVGIGEVSPLGKLHVKDGDAGSITANSAHDTVIIEGSGNTGINIFSPNTSYQYLAFGDTEGSNSGYVRYQHSTNQMVLRAGGDDTFYVDAGKVMIDRPTSFTTGGIARLSIDTTASAVAWSAGLSNTDLIYFRRQGTGRFAFQTYDSANDGHIEFQPYGGSVGIGTTDQTTGKLNIDAVADSTWLHLRNQSESAFNFNIYNDGTGDASNTPFTKLGISHSTTRNSSINFYRGADSSGGFMAFTTNTDIERMRIDSSGNVGIGTTSPGHLLEVSGTGADGTELFHITSDGDVADGGYHWMTTEIAGSQSTDANIIHFIGKELANKNGGYFGFHYAGDNSDNNFITLGGYQADQLLNIKMNGNVGIGTTSPTEKLDVEGDAQIGDALNLRSSGTLAGIGFNRKVSNGAIYNSSIPAYQLHNNGGDFELQHYNDAGGFLGYPFFVQGSSGNVGIGTDNPTDVLHVDMTAGSRDIFFQNGGTNDEEIFYGTAKSTGNSAAIRWRSDGLSIHSYGQAYGSMLFIDANSSNVGIGTTSPNAKLDVNGNIAISNATSPPNVPTTYDQLYLGDRSQIYNRTGLGLSISTNNEFGGSPIHKYQANGTAGLIEMFGNSFKYYNAPTGNAGQTPSWTNRFTIDANGYVGIGTASPTSSLEVQGDITVNSGIIFKSPDDAQSITQTMLDTNILSWSGTAGQLFSVSNSLTGTIFSVNDVSGVPSIEVDDDGTIRLAETFGNVLIGTAADDGVSKLQVDGSVNIVKTNSISETDWANTSHLILDNTGTQTKMLFRAGNANKGGIRVDSSGNMVFTAGSSAYYFNYDSDAGGASASGHFRNSGGSNFLSWNGTDVTVPGTLTVTGALTGTLTGTASNANTLDTLDSTQFLRSDTADVATQINSPIFSGDIATTGDGQNNYPFRLTSDYNSYMVATATNTWGLFWAGNTGARYGTNGLGGPGNIWSNSGNPNEFVFVGSDSTKWTLFGNNGNTWQAGTLTTVGSITTGGDITGVNIIGNGSQLTAVDAETLDGIDSTSFLRSDVADTMTGALTLQQTLGNITHLTLKQQNTSSDITSQKAFIDFTFVDSNANGTPQVRIGANVGEDGGDAGTQLLEGSGEFVVYTATGTTLSANSLTEKFRVSHDGKLFAGSDRVFTDGYHPNADTWTTARTATVTLTGDATGTAGVSVNGSANWTNSVAVTVDKIDGQQFVNTRSNSGRAANSTDGNGIYYYTSDVDNFSGNATDGAMYQQSYSSSWFHQIAGDYRSGNIALRGKNNNIWQRWKKVPTIYTSDTAPTTALVNDDFWFDSDEGKLKIRYAGVWVDTFTLGTAGFVNKSGDTMTGSLTISTIVGNNSGTLNVTGDIVASGDVTAYSDMTLKSNIQTIDNALDKVTALRGVTFEKDGRNGSGVIAQEVEKVLPEVVHTNDDGLKSVAYGNMVGTLIEAMKQQQEQINQLTDEIKKLKGE